jgi:hypothetical protein
MVAIDWDRIAALTALPRVLPCHIPAYPVTAILPMLPDWRNRVQQAKEILWCIDGRIHTASIGFSYSRLDCRLAQPVRREVCRRTHLYRSSGLSTGDDLIPCEVGGRDPPKDEVILFHHFSALSL